MINILIKSLEIDIVYAVNSLIYSLRNLPILKDLLTDDAYESKVLKIVIGIIGIVLSTSRAILFKAFYYFVIYSVCKTMCQNNYVNATIHLYFLLTILGMFINNKLLNTSKKKYFSIILFNMDATKFYKANIFWNTIVNFTLNSICLFILAKFLSLQLIYPITLLLFTTFIRFIGESLNIMFYKKYDYMWYSNTTLYFTILLIILGLSLLPIINVTIPFKIIELVTIFTIIIGTLSLIYLFNIKDYKLMYKRLNNKVNVMDSDNEKAYLKQAMVEVKKKDIELDSKKIKGKKGFDLFNTIFFERHKEILLRSAKKYALIIGIIYIILIFICYTNNIYLKQISNFLNNRLAIFVFVMYFVNRGAIITQAMFFNCDHAMLSYNFYREPKTLLGLFKKRLITVIKVNLLPAITIGIGNAIILGLNNTSIFTIMCMIIFIICLSIFFSTHYLVIYYLLQPYNKNMEMRKISYSITTLLTYIVCYQMFSLVLNINILSIFGIMFSCLYIIISLVLVYKIAPQTFKLN